MVDLIVGRDERDPTSIDIESKSTCDSEIDVLCLNPKTMPLMKSIFKRESIIVPEADNWPSCNELIEAYSTITCCESFSNLAKFDGENGFDQFVRKSLSLPDYDKKRESLFGK